MHLALGPIVRLFSRSIYHDIESKFFWHETRSISKETEGELKFWLKNINNSLNVYCASEEGYGGFIVNRLNDIICCTKLKQNDKQISSTYRGLLAVKYVLSSFGHILKNQPIKVNIDNSSACRTLTVGKFQNILTKYCNQCV